MSSCALTYFPNVLPFRHWCRWATEDPNPAAKRKEHKRLLTEGEKGIQVSLDPEFVQRVRELDELEGKVAAAAESSPLELEEGLSSTTMSAEVEGEEAEGQRKAKRARIEAPPAATVVEAQTRNNNTVPAASSTSADSATPTPAPAPGGILSGHAVASLQVLAQLREKRLQEAKAAGLAPPPPAPAPAKLTAKPATGLGGLAAYGSDDESD